jgi:hypothetical protein
MENIDLTTLCNILHYDKDTGVFTWAVARPKIKVGQVAGHLHYKGYINIELFGKHYSAHRLAWFYVTGVWPQETIDHINRVRNDNRFENLREATRRQNRQNSQYVNKTGYTGVTFKKWMKNKPYSAAISIGGKPTHIGCYSTAEEAAEAYKIKSIELHGDFSVFNFYADRAACSEF